MSNRNKLPSVTSPVDMDLRKWIDRVGEVIGSLSTQYVARGDLESSVITIISDTGDGADDDDDTFDGIPVLTPPAPTGFNVTGGYEFNIIEWDNPSYYGHNYTRIWASETVNFEDATILAETDLDVFSHYAGVNQTFYYWIAWVNVLDVQGPEVGPVEATTAIDVEEVRAALTGKLTSTEFVDELATFLGNGSWVQFGPKQYTVKISSEGVTAGFGLADTGVDQPEFDFAILADNFFITPPVAFNQPTPPPSGNIGDVWRRPQQDLNTARYYIRTEQGTWEEFDAVPFIVRTTDTTITNEDGEEIFVPQGVYISSAYIQDGTITNVKVGRAAIDNAKIADATITSAKIGALDANKIQTGAIQSFNWRNQPGYAGFFLDLGVREVFEDRGETNASGDPILTRKLVQEDVTLIIRGALESAPALQLVNGVVTINAAVIRDTLRSVNYSANRPGFEFDIDAGTFTFRGPGGQILFSTGGVNEDVVSDAISTELSSLQADLDAAQATANAARTDADSAQAAAAAAQADATQAQNTAGTSLINANTARNVADQASITASNALFTANTATNTANTANSNAVNALNTANAAVSPYELGVALADKLDVSEFNTLQGQLRAFAFLDKITPSNIGTYMQSAAIGTAYIGNAAVGTAQIGQGAITTALIDNAAVTNAKIANLAVDTLKIAGEATMVPRFATGTVNNRTFFRGSYTDIVSVPISVGNTGQTVRLMIIGNVGFYPTDGTAATVALAIRTSSNQVNTIIGQSVLGDGETIAITGSFPVGPYYSGGAKLSITVDTPGASSKRGSVRGGIIVMAVKR